MSSRELEERQERVLAGWIAAQIGLTIDELDQLEWVYDEKTLSDGTPIGLIVTFEEDGDPDLLQKIDGLSNFAVRLGFPPDNPHPPEPDSAIEEERSIDPALIGRWFAIDATQPIEIELPRASLDMLYVAIERSYFALAQAVEMVTAQQRGEAAVRDAALAQLKADVVRGLNSLRSFQTIVMASATNTQLDEVGKVMSEESTSGE